MEHDFSGPNFTIGVEEELMIVDGETLDLVNAIESFLEDSPAGAIKPELMESVLEVSTDPCSSIGEAERQLRALRGQVREIGAQKGLAIGSAGTHPFAMWEDQRIVGRTRYRDLISALRFVARQELIFGMHVHVGLDDADMAIHVANGMRVHVGVLLALSANSPFWRADSTGLQSTRTPIFRAFPRVGIPPRYEGWEDYERRVEFMVHSGVVEDYTWLWYDVRPHPYLGTVEIRAMRLADAHRAHDRHRRARAGDGQGACRALPRGQALSRTTRGRCSTRTSGWRPATASTASSSTFRPTSACRRASSCGACSTACARTPRTSARRRPSMRSRISWPAATAPPAS